MRQSEPSDGAASLPRTKASRSSASRREPSGDGRGATSRPGARRFGRGSPSPASWAMRGWQMGARDGAREAVGEESDAGEGARERWGGGEGDVGRGWDGEPASCENPKEGSWVGPGEGRDPLGPAWADPTKEGQGEGRSPPNVAGPQGPRRPSRPHGGAWGEGRVSTRDRSATGTDRGHGTAATGRFRIST